jgi:hypothetical protein
MIINGLLLQHNALHVLWLFRRQEVATSSCTLMISQYRVAPAATSTSLLQIKRLISAFSRPVLMLQPLQALIRNASMMSISINTTLTEESMAPQL